MRIRRCKIELYCLYLPVHSFEKCVIHVCVLCFLKSVIFFFENVNFDKSILILITQQMHQLKTLLRQTSMSTRRQKYHLIPQEGISGHKHDKKNFNPVLHSGKACWLVLNEKKKKKIIKKSEKRLKNLIKKSHKTLLVFSVKVKCHVQKVLSFNTSKRVCNLISFFM